MRYSICLDALYSGKDFIESMREIKSLGFNAFEFWAWWEEKDIDKINTARLELGLEVAAFCTKFVSLVDKTKRDVYIKGLKETIPVAKKLDCKVIISQVGDELKDITRAAQQLSMIDGLKEAASLLEGGDIILAIEPLNTRVDHEGYFMWQSDEAVDILDRVGSPNVKMLFDIYHQQIMEGDIIRRCLKNLDKIVHFHVAGNPGRHELDDGEINYPGIFKALDEAGYSGYIGVEYNPKRDVKEGLRDLLR